MKRLFLLFCITLSLVTGLSVVAQAPVFVPVVNPEMIEISFDGITFQEASAYVSGIVISTGVASASHIYHARRGTKIHFEAQLDGHYATEKVEWLLDTGLLPAKENKLYMRYTYGIEEPIGSGQYITTDVSPASEVVKLIGRPGKPIRTLITVL